MHNLVSINARIIGFFVVLAISTGEHELLFQSVLAWVEHVAAVGAEFDARHAARFAGKEDLRNFKSQPLVFQQRSRSLITFQGLT